MSTRSDDLTADLLHDLTEEQARPPEPAAVPSAPAAPSAVVETSLYLAPSTWKRPGIARGGRSLSINAGPVRVRIGRTDS